LRDFFMPAMAKLSHTPTLYVELLTTSTSEYIHICIQEAIQLERG
jgi:hypothetical protein